MDYNIYDSESIIACYRDYNYAMCVLALCEHNRSMTLIKSYTNLDWEMPF